jgi:SPP1 family predicted phage head-tail adaptor
MIDPGMLKTRLVIQAPAETPDDQGGIVRTYTTFATVWASVAPLGARADVQADAEGATAAYRIILRNNFSLTLQHRFSDGPRIYRIVTIRDRDDKRFIEVDTEVRID